MTKQLIKYPFPLRDDLVIYLHLPEDLTNLEVNKLNKFLITLAIELEAAGLDDNSKSIAMEKFEELNKKYKNMMKNLAQENEI